MISKTLSLFALLPLSTAHFVLTWPTNRGFSDDQAGNFPCGGFNGVKTPRTEVPMSNIPIQLDMEHTQTNLAVYLAIGNDPDESYNVMLRPQLAQEGLGNFCIGGINIPSNLNISAGTNATIQVVSNGDPDGGLYQCADVTFTSDSLSSSDYSSHCENGTGIRVTSENISGNPNETSEASPSSSGSGTAASATATPGAAAHVAAASWILGAAGAVGFALL